MSRNRRETNARQIDRKKMARFSYSVLSVLTFRFLLVTIVFGLKKREPCKREDSVRAKGTRVFRCTRETYTSCTRTTAADCARATAVLCSGDTYHSYLAACSFTTRGFFFFRPQIFGRHTLLFFSTRRFHTRLHNSHETVSIRTADCRGQCTGCNICYPQTRYVIYLPTNGEDLNSGRIHLH